MPAKCRRCAGSFTTPRNSASCSGHGTAGHERVPRWHARPVTANLLAFTKGLILLALTVAAFLFTPWPRDVVALAAAGLLLLSRRMASREMIGLVDWHLLVLFIGLFVVNDAVERAGLLREMYAGLASAGIDLARPEWLFVMTPLISNLVSNVPAVILLLPASSGPQAGAVLALASTFAGNLLIVGSIANIIVVEQAGRRGIVIDWRAHARTGVPVTLATLAIAAVWLWVRAR